MPRIWQVVCLMAAGCTTSQGVIAVGSVAGGGACTQIAECQAGFACVDNLCAALPTAGVTRGRGMPCSGSMACDTGLFCGRQGFCTRTAPAAMDGACGLLEDCQADLVCNFAGRCVDPQDPAKQAGTANLNEACGPTDCQRPYVCGLTGVCTRLPFSSGVDCHRDYLETGDFRVYFEVPDSPDAEFYRLPFPTDIRRDAVTHRLDLRGHHSPGSVLGVDVTGQYLAAVQSDAASYAENQPVFMRTSHKLDLTSVCLSSGSVYPAVDKTDQVEGAPSQAFDPNCPVPSILLVNIDARYAASSDPLLRAQYGQAVPVELAFGRAAGHYICSNWLGVAPRAGIALNPNTTYAVLVTHAIRATYGVAPIQDTDFAAMLADTAPQGELASSRPALVSAYQAMAPLRTYLQTQPSLGAQLAAASVFTTGNPTEVAEALKTAVYAEPAPTFDSNTTVHCTSPAVISPCDDGFALPGTPQADPNHLHQRGCFVANPNYVELQGRYLNNPVVQDGARPYNTEGGVLRRGPNGQVIVQGHESMCYALTVPTAGSMPADGWPLLIYAHGTGGSYRTFTLDGTAQALGHEFAIIGFDGVLHGFRQGNDPNAWSADAQVPLLFFNVVNPRASRDNILQGAADLHTLTRLVRHQALTSPIGTVRFDPNRIYFVGHSQGTVVAPPYLSTDLTLRGAVLGGAGAELPLSLVNKTSPVNIAQLIGAFFGDRNIARIHPMMGVMALLFAPVEALSYGAMLTHAPARQGDLPLFLVMGMNDSFTPDVTQQALAVAANLPLLSTPLAVYPGISRAVPPQAVGAAQYNADGDYDGHFVMFQNAQARSAVRAFLQSAVQGTPQINP